MNIIHEIKIHAAPEVVWAALTDAEITPLYMYGCEVIFEPKVGANIVWKGKADGIVYVDGKVKEWLPNKVFRYSVLDPENPHGDTDEKCLIVSYEISEINKQSCILKITQGDFANINNGKQRYDEHLAQPAWPDILKQLKEIIEKD